MAYGFSDNIFTALIGENGDIFEAPAGRKHQKVGIDNQREQEMQSQMVMMQEKLDKYYTRLVELGEIVLPKTAEEIAQEAATEQLRLAQEQAEQQAELIQTQNMAMAKMMAMLENMESRLGESNNGYIGNGKNGNEYSDGAIGENSQSILNTKKTNKPVRSKGSDKSRDEDIA